MRYEMAKNMLVEQVADEVAVTKPNGDVIVLNETAGEVARAFLEGEQSIDETSVRLTDRFCVDEERVRKDIRRTVRELCRLGVLIPRRKEKRNVIVRSHISRRKFVAGMAAAGLTLLKPARALGEESARVANQVFNASAYGYFTGEATTTARVWMDSLDRSIELPDRIEKVAPYGPYAQAVLESIDPDMVVQVTARGMHASLEETSESEARRLAQEAGGEANISLEAVEENSPDVILDLATSKARLEKHIDEIQTESGVPIVHMVASAEDLPQVYRTLGDLLNKDSAYNLADLYSRILVTLAQGREHIGEAKTVYFGQGADGLNTRNADTLLDKITALSGAKNIAHDLSADACRNLDAAAVREWDPDVIVLSIPDFYDNDEEKELVESIWKGSDMAEGREILIAPSDPVPWLASSPLVMQTVGALWLAHSIYPDVYTFDLEKTVQEVFDAFFHVDISKSESEEMLDKTRKAW